MDSLIATYASSDEEEDTNQRQPHSQNPAMVCSMTSSSLFSSLPPPSRNFASLPPPKNCSSLKTLNEGLEEQQAKRKPSSLFSSMPPPKSHSTAKRLVEFKPPINYALHHDDDDDNPRPKKMPPPDSAASAGGLSAILPPPKNTPLGAGAGESGNLGRRSVLEIPSFSVAEPQPSPTPEPNSVYAPQYEYEAYSNNGDNYSAVDPPYSMAAWSHSRYDSNISTVEEERNVQDEAQTQVVGGREKGDRRGRNKIPCDVIEVKQDELMSNRPREDQVKLTGIAFGPSYKPVSAAKDKPSKLHKRKHQIGSLYYELKQKEMELAERRSRGHLTKAETQAKYGW